jgi:hypothetical protein
LVDILACAFGTLIHLPPLSPLAPTSSSVAMATIAPTPNESAEDEDAPDFTIISNDAAEKLEAQARLNTIRRDSQLAVEGFTRQLNKIESENRVLIHPTGQFATRWDVVLILSMLFTCFVTPYEIALLATNWDMLFVCNRVVDIIFTVDLIVNFRMMFYNEQEMKLVKDRKLIAKHYIHSWFVIDFLSVIPGYADWFTVGREQSADSAAMKVGEILRLFRLIKMGRMLKASRIIDRWLTMVNITSTGITVLRNTMLAIVSTHWMACLWALVLTMEGHATATDRSVWIYTWSPSPCATPFSHVPDADPDAPWDTCLSAGNVYIIALYWSMINLVSGSALWVNNPSEYVAGVVVMMVGGFTWAYILAHITAVAVNVSYEVAQHNQTMDQVNEFITSNRVRDGDFAVKLRTFVNYSRHRNRDKSRQSLLRKLSPALGGRCAKLGSRSVLQSKIKWLKHIALHQPSSMLDFMLRLKASVCGPQESVHRAQTMFLICKGVVARDANILCAGNQWGEDSVLLVNPAHWFVSPAWTVTFVHLWTLEREDWTDLFLMVSDETRLTMRNAQLWFALRRGIQIYASKQPGGAKVMATSIRTVIARERMRIAKAETGMAPKDVAERRNSGRPLRKAAGLTIAHDAAPLMQGIQNLIQDRNAQLLTDIQAMITASHADQGSQMQHEGSESDGDSAVVTTPAKQNHVVTVGASEKFGDAPPTPSTTVGFGLRESSNLAHLGEARRANPDQINL